MHVTHKAYALWKDSQEEQHTLVGGVVTADAHCVLEDGWDGLAILGDIGV